MNDRKADARAKYRKFFSIRSAEGQWNRPSKEAIEQITRSLERIARDRVRTR